MGYGMFEFFHERSKATDHKLLALAGTKAACLIGCQFCIDIGSHISREAGVTEEQLRTLHAYRESPAFSPLERLVLEYAEAMCQTPVMIADELFARLREHFSDEQIVELTTAIAIENFRARFNNALDITPAGFSEGAACPLPDAVAVSGGGAHVGVAGRAPTRRRRSARATLRERARDRLGVVEQPERGRAGAASQRRSGACRRAAARARARPRARGRAPRPAGRCERRRCRRPRVTSRAGPSSSARA